MDGEVAVGEDVAGQEAGPGVGVEDFAERRNIREAAPFLTVRRSLDSISPFTFWSKKSVSSSLMAPSTLMVMLAAAPSSVANALSPSACLASVAV